MTALPDPREVRSDKYLRRREVAAVVLTHPDDRYPSRVYLCPEWRAKRLKEGLEEEISVLGYEAHIVLDVPVHERYNVIDIEDYARERAEREY